MLSEEVKRALAHDGVIDITTTGRSSGEPRRIEIWFHSAGGKYYITGTPGTRSWYANMRANPEFTFHLKQSIKADLPATAEPVMDPEARRKVLLSLPRLKSRFTERPVAEWVERSPLVEVKFR
jgi:deazaflavin-dependent oxidoreductase (nitroreductase family)